MPSFTIQRQDNAVWRAITVRPDKDEAIEAADEMKKRSPIVHYRVVHSGTGKIVHESRAE